MQENLQKVAIPGLLHWDAIYNFISCCDFPERLIPIFRSEKKLPMSLSVQENQHKLSNSNRSQT